RGFDRVFQLGQPRVRIILRRAVFPKQRRRDHVDAFVRGLRGENCGYEELKGIPKIQFAMCVWINFRPGFQKLADALASDHPIIILQGSCAFQPADRKTDAECRSSHELASNTLQHARTLAERNARVRRLILTDETMPTGTYCGVGDGDGDVASAAGASALPDVLVLSSSLRCFWARRSSFLLSFSFLRVSICSESGISCRASGGSCCSLLSFSACNSAGSPTWPRDRALG